MFRILLENITKPFTGLVLLVQLFAGGETGLASPGIGELQLISGADSVYIYVKIKNGLTYEIEELIMNGTKVTTTFRFRCDTLRKTFNKSFQYNPIQGSACYSSINEVCDSTFTINELDILFNTFVFSIGGKNDVQNLHNSKAKLIITVSAQLDAYALGKKELWPADVSQTFRIPEVP